MKRVFLGGTCAGSNWRDELIKLLNISYFNPVVENWDETAQKNELKEREECDYCLYVITPDMTGVYSIAEVVDDSNRRPDKTVFCVINATADGFISEFDEKVLHSLKAVKKLVARNGGKVLEDLREVANYLNNEGE